MALEDITAPIRVKPFDFDDRQMEVYHATGETETFRLIDWHEFSPDCVTLPIDKIVAGLVKERLT